LSKFISDFKKNGNKIDMNDENSGTVENSNAATPKQSELQALKSKIRLLQKEKETLKRTIAILMADE